MEKGGNGSKLHGSKTCGGAVGGTPDDDHHDLGLGCCCCLP